jgi:hypothetical protein
LNENLKERLEANDGLANVFLPRRCQIYKIILINRLQKMLSPQWAISLHQMFTFVAEFQKIRSLMHHKLFEGFIHLKSILRQQVKKLF